MPLVSVLVVCVPVVMSDLCKLNVNLPSVTYYNAQCDVHIIIVYFLVFYKPNYSSLAPDVCVCVYMRVCVHV